MRCKDWKKVTIDDLFHVRNGASIPSKSFHDNSDLANNYEAFKMGHIAVGGGLRTDPKRSYVARTGKLDKYLLEKDDIVMGMTDMKDRVVILGVPAIIEESNRYLQNQRVASLRKRGDASFDIRFVYYQMLTSDYLKPLQSRANRGVQVNLTTDHIKNSTIYLPSLEIQKKIVRILSALDQKIELNNQESENLRKIIKALYGNTATSIKEKTKLADLTKISSGKRPASIETSGEYVIVGARDVMGFTNKYNQEPEVIITGRVGTLGVVKRYQKKTWASDNTLIVDTRYKNYIECYLSSVDFGAYNRGSTQPLITQTDLKNFVLPFDKGKCDSFENKTAPLRNKMFAIEEQNEELIILRDTLLPRLMEGTMDLNKVGL